jgi:protein TonB
MERPSHINLRTSHTFSSRLLWSGAAIALPLAMVWGFNHGMVGEVFPHFGPLHMVPVVDPVKPQTPPPQPKLQNIPRLTVEQPLIQIAPDSSNDRITASVTPPVLPNSDQATTPVVGPDRAPVAIAGTHTTPPYPMLARRLGKEGKVTLRLTVLADGKVGKAEIVTSSGSSDLDDSAEAWIVAHWIYKPALDKGQPAASQTMATVVFSLRDQ